MDIILMEDIETITCKLCTHEVAAVDSIEGVCDECYDAFHAEVPLSQEETMLEGRWDEEEG